MRRKALSFALSATDRNEALAVPASKSGGPAHILEKDAWVVWTLSALFRSPFAQHLIFKGGTSLSKVYRASDRFSEDIDVTYDIRAIAPDLAKDAGPDALPASRSQAAKWRDIIEERLAKWPGEQVLPCLQECVDAARLAAQLRIEKGESIYIDYETRVSEYAYVGLYIKIEFGARSTGERSYREASRRTLPSQIRPTTAPPARSSGRIGTPRRRSPPSALRCRIRRVLSCTLIVRLRRKFQARRRRWAAALMLCAGIAAHDTRANGPLIFDCRKDDGHCPEIIISGDPPAQIQGYGLAPFHGYADPSLRHDSRTGALWLSYSWVSTLIAPTSVPGKPIIDIGVSIHLARSDDGGRTFHYVRSLWSSDPVSYEGADGYSGHEVSTISQTGAGWAALDLRYFNPRSNGNDFAADSFHFEFAEGADLEHLATANATRLGGPLTARAWQPFVNLSALAAVGIACPVWTEPSLFEDGGVLYLLAQCKTPRKPAEGFLGLFARQASGWRWVGRLTVRADAATFGGNELTQAELARGRDGSLLLIVTPNIVTGREEHHLGCTVLSIASLYPPSLLRNGAGAPIVRARVVSSDSAQNGPGACAYDPASATGLLIVRRMFNAAKGVIFSIHATGVQP